MSVQLVGITFSPWTEKARWALEVRGIEHRFVPYVPLIGEPRLRVLLRRWRGPVSVPILVDGKTVIPDSAAIARWADAHGTGPAMFPREHDARVTHFVDESERGLAAGRARALVRILADDAALAELVPKPIARTIGARATRGLAAFGIRRTRRKYGADAGSDDDHARTQIEVLDGIRAALGGRRTILDALSFADIAASQVLAYVAPPASGLRLGAANRRSFTDAALAERFADLVHWRDELYAAHR